MPAIEEHEWIAPIQHSQVTVDFRCQDRISWILAPGKEILIAYRRPLLGAEHNIHLWANGSVQDRRRLVFKKHQAAGEAVFLAQLM
jgi:hypothetical protein